MRIQVRESPNWHDCQWFDVSVYKFGRLIASDAKGISGCYRTLNPTFDALAWKAAAKRRAVRRMRKKFRT